MQLTDSRGIVLSTQSVGALERYETAARQSLGYVGDPMAVLDEALAEDPDFAGAHAFRADLAVMASAKSALPIIQSSIEAPLAEHAVMSTSRPRQVIRSAGEMPRRLRSPAPAPVSPDSRRKVPGVRPWSHSAA